MDKNETKSGLDNVISLESRRARRNKSDAGAPDPSPGGQENPPAPPSEGTGQQLAPIPGILIWLRCATCGTLEYSEVVVAGGRRHNCGTVVEEAVVEVDTRAECTIARINLERIQALESYLSAQRQHFETYLERMEIVAGKSPEPYQVVEEPMKFLPVAEIDPLGLLIPKALHEPARRFEDDRDGQDGQDGQDG